MPSTDETRQLLDGIREGRHEAWSRLFEIVYDDLRRAARSSLRSQPEATLSTTAMVNEAYLRLAGRSLSVNDRVHFMAVAARAMRCVLVDAARRKHAQKRGAGVDPMPIEGPGDVGTPEDLDVLRVLELDAALGRLADVSERLARVVELRFFGGLTVDETAEVLEVGVRTVERDWFKARAFLHRELSRS